MKDIHKIYLIFWSPIIILVIFSSLILYQYKKSLTPLSEIRLSSNYIEIINKLNTLNSLESFKFLEEYTVIVDPFSVGFKEASPKLNSIPTQFKSSKTFHLSMIYIEGTKKICIINDNKFIEGSKLEKDIKILRIGDYYVDLQIRNNVKRLLLGQTFSF